jgi:multiple sugar transport system substrate-binding protein
MKAMPALQANKYDEGILSKWGKVAGDGLEKGASYDQVVAAFKKEVKNTYPELQVE